MSQTTCTACGAPIRWERSAKGVANPLNPEPDPNGNVVLIEGVSYYIGKYPPREWDDLPRYTSHFVNCPEAASFRKRKS